MTAGREEPLVFACKGEPLVGIVHHAASPSQLGVLIVVGGPQYRVGSQRQFVLLARALAAAGIPAMRFDYRGMGDSCGAFVGFERIDEDIASAITAFRQHCTGLEEVVIWGLCDAASAALFYAYRDPSVCGLVLVNPWVRTSAGEARTYLKHYYTARLLDPAFWRKLFSGRFELGASLRSLMAMIGRASVSATAARPKSGPLTGLGGSSSIPLPDRMAEGLRRFNGPVLLIISGNDYTAKEFEEAAAASPLWRELLAAPRVMRHDLPDADHTFSRRIWRDQVAAWTAAWLMRIGATSGINEP